LGVLCRLSCRKRYTAHRYHHQQVRDRDTQGVFSEGHQDLSLVGNNRGLPGSKDLTLMCKILEKEFLWRSLVGHKFSVPAKKHRYHRPATILTT
jgi:hypothetical protein